MLNVINENESKEMFYDSYFNSFLIIKNENKFSNMKKYSFILQAINDKELKSGMISGVRLKNRLASLDIKSFKSNSSEFVIKNAISLDCITNKIKKSSIVDIQFVKISSYSYEIEFVINASKKDASMMVEAYFLGYSETSQSNKSPAYIDIPKHPSKTKFLFTGTLSSSSVVVTELNETTYRVYHDERVNSSLLYDNVVMAVDYKDYQNKGAHTRLTKLKPKEINFHYTLMKTKKYDAFLMMIDYLEKNNSEVTMSRYDNGDRWWFTRS